MNDIWRKRHNDDLMRLCDSFARMNRLKRIGHVNRMDSQLAVSQVFCNISQGSGVRGRPKNRWWNCVQADINRRKIKNRADWEK